MKLKDKTLPVRFIKFDKYKHKVNKWSTKGIKKQLNIKISFTGYSRAQQWGNRIFLYTIRYWNSIRETIIHYYNAEFEKSKHDIKKTWRTIADIIQISKNKPKGIKCTLGYERPVTDQLVIANKFNVFFINCDPFLTKNMPTTRSHNDRKDLTGNTLSSLQFDLVGNFTIAKTVHSNKSKSSSGCDGIPTKLLKFLSPP